MTDAMPTPFAPEGPRFSIGRAFAMTLGVLGRNLWAMAPVALAVTAIQSGIDYALTGDPLGNESGANSVIAIFVYALITAPVTYGTFQDLRGARVGTVAMISGGFHRVGRVIGASFVVGLVAFVPAIFAGLFWVMSNMLGIVFGAAAAVFLVYVLVLWFVVIPVLVVEDVRFSSSFSRSAELSRGRRWRMLGLLLTYGVMVVAVGAATLMINEVAVDAPVLGLILVLPLIALYSVVGAILPAVTYYLLRAEKEGIGIEDIVKVFD